MLDLQADIIFGGDGGAKISEFFDYVKSIVIDDCQTQFKWNVQNSRNLQSINLYSLDKILNTSGMCSWQYLKPVEILFLNMK